MTRSLGCWYGDSLNARELPAVLRYQRPVLLGSERAIRFKNIVSKRIDVKAIARQFGDVNSMQQQ